MYDQYKRIIPRSRREQIFCKFNNNCWNENSVSCHWCYKFFVGKNVGNQIAQHLTLNEFKYFHIFKELKGIPSSGLVTVVSTVWGCHISDRHIIQEMASCFYSIFKGMTLVYPTWNSELLTSDKLILDQSCHHMYPH